MRNLIIASSMLVLGLGAAVLEVGPVTLSGTALCAIAGIVLNLILPHEKNGRKIIKTLANNKGVRGISGVFFMP